MGYVSSHHDFKGDFLMGYASQLVHMIWNDLETQMPFAVNSCEKNSSHTFDHGVPWCKGLTNTKLPQHRQRDLTTAVFKCHFFLFLSGRDTHPWKHAVMLGLALERCNTSQVQLLLASLARPAVQLQSQWNYFSTPIFCNKSVMGVPVPSILLQREVHSISKKAAQGRSCGCALIR